MIPININQSFNQSMPVINESNFTFQMDEESDSDWESTLSVAADSTRKIFACPYEGCSKTFSKKGRLNVHVLSHTGEKPFKCDDCEAGYSRLSHLKRHIDNVHKKIRHSCSICPATFFSKEAAKKHEKIAHGDGNGNRLRCDECGKTFAKRYQLANHAVNEHDVKMEKKVHACDECEKTFPYPNKLKLHKESRHSKAPRHKCDICDSAFHAFNELRKHKATEHKKTFNCQKCEKEFKTRANLNSHLKVHEEQSEVFHCPEIGCQETFLYLRNLKNHARVAHDGHAHQCQECENSYASRRGLARHVAAVHKGEEEKTKVKKCRRPMKSMASRLANVELEPTDDKALIRQPMKLCMDSIRKEIGESELLAAEFAEESTVEEGDVVNAEICLKQRANQSESRNGVRNSFFDTLKQLESN